MLYDIAISASKLDNIGYISDMKFNKRDTMSQISPSPSNESWVYGSFSGRLGSYSEDNVKPLTKRELSRTGSFQDTRSRHSSGMSEGEPSQYSGKYSMLEFSMVYFRENLDRYSTRPNEMGIQSNIKLIENSKLPGLKRKKSFTKQKDTEKLQRQESWSWKEQADMIKWTKTPIVSSLLKLPTEQMNKVAVDCFYSIQQFMGDQPLGAAETDVDCVFRILKASHQCSELRDEIYCQLARQTTNNKSSNSQSCLRGWRLFTLLACWFSPSDVLKPFLINYIQQNASDPSRPYHASAHNCLQMLRKTMKFRGRRNVPSIEEITDIARGKLIKRQAILLPGGIPFYSNISPSTVVQDIIDEICSKLGVVSQMEQDEYTVFAMVESNNEYSRLKREEYIMDVVTELRLQGKECALIFERTSWYFPLRIESATYEYLDMMFMQSIPDYIDGYLLTLDHNSTIPPRQLDDIVSIAALLYRSAGYEDRPESLKEVESYFPGPVLSLGLLRHQQFLDGVNRKLARLTNFSSEDCKVEALNMLKRWPLFGASFFSIQCLTEPKVTGDCLLAVNRAGIHFLHHKTHKVILSYPFTDIISSRKISSAKISDTQYLDIKVGNNMVQKVVRVETSQGPDIAHLIGQYVKAVNSSAKLSS
ncbi:unconventional myosin-XV-like [Watersipora subatra]|uniref:unconventional myosin-XV-like n=1 Tax=Watersipora subatra TaxID=2589382 RepID=UPI00355C4C90